MEMPVAALRAVSPSWRPCTLSWRHASACWAGPERLRRHPAGDSAVREVTRGKVRWRTITGTPPPLDGIRVLDLSRIIAGPLCTQQLADLGADVIKVEHPVTGDELRARSPLGDRRGAAFLAFNRSKRSVAIDLGQHRGQQLARQLIAGSDVVIENFRPGVMDRLGLGRAELQAADPALIFVSISAYGSQGPSSSR